jgi:sec-independent protein translocase protein TatB
MFDLSIPKILVLAVIALVVFGPDQLPRLAAQAGRALRDFRRMADNARAELSEGLGPEFGEFDLADLNPRSFVRKHLLDDSAEAAAGQPYLAEPAISGHDGPPLLAGEAPPYDSEAT